MSIERFAGKLCESSFAVAMSDHPLSLASARQIAHDAVIERTGPQRRSGVVWTYFDAATAPADVKEIGIEDLPADARALCAMFPSGLLVVATVEITE